MTIVENSRGSVLHVVPSPRQQHLGTDPGMRRRLGQPLPPPQRERVLLGLRDPT